MATLPMFTATNDAINNARDSMLYGISERMHWEREHNPVARDLESITSFLTRFYKSVVKTDAFTLSYFATHAADFGNVFLSHRRVSACFNVYAMPKAMNVARCLNGSTLSGDDANDETISGVILAMGRGVSNGKSLANAVNDHMNRDGKRGSYASGGTQASSALRALEALGVVREAGRDGSCKLWGIGNGERFDRMLDAARGIPNTGESASPPDADTFDADTFDGVTLDGECETVPDMLALASECDVTEAECEAPPMLALPAPKAKRVRAKRS